MASDETLEHICAKAEDWLNENRSANETHTTEDGLCQEYTGHGNDDGTCEGFPYHYFVDPSRTVDNEDGWKAGRPSFVRSAKRCLLFALSTTVISGIPVGLYTTTLAWLDLRLAEACYSHPWKETPVFVQRVKLTAQVVEGIFIQSWSFTALLFLFGLRRVREVNIPVWNVLGALFDAIYRLFIHTYGMYDVSWKSYPLNLLFAAITAFNFYRVTHLFLKNTRPRIVLASKLGMAFIFGTPLFIMMNYFLFPVYTKVPSDTVKAVFSVLLPVIFIVPKAVINIFLVDVSTYCSTKYSSLLVIGFHTMTTVIARYLQANIEEMKIFVVICVAHGLKSLVDKVTLKWRLKAYRMFCKSCKRGQEDRTEQRKRQIDMNRLLAEQSISGMVLETDTIIFSCALVAILTYYYGNWNQIWNDIGAPFMKRVSVAVSIDLVFNFLCTKVLTYYYNLPVIRIWRKRWGWIMAVICTYTVYAMLYCSEYLYQPVLSHATYNKSKLASCPNATIQLL